MKHLLTSLLILCLAFPLSAKTYSFTDGKLKGQSFKTKDWPQHKCDTYISITRAQNRQLVDHCIGKMTKGDYAGKYQKFLVDYKDAKDDRVKRITRSGAMALLHPDIKWKSETYKEGIFAAKMTAIAVGAAIAMFLAVSTGISSIAIPAHWSSLH